MLIVNSDFYCRISSENDKRVKNKNNEEIYILDNIMY